MVRMTSLGTCQPQGFWSVDSPETVHSRRVYVLPRSLCDVLMRRLQLTHHLLDCLDKHRLELPALPHKLLGINRRHHPVIDTGRPRGSGEKTARRGRKVEDASRPFELRARMTHCDKVGQTGLAVESESDLGVRVRGAERRGG
jgi:hypothetical protein